MSKPVIRNCFNSSMRVIHPVGERAHSRVKQEFSKEVDINYIVHRMKKGISPPSWMTSRTPRFGDFSDMPQSLMESFAIVQNAREAFESLPLEFRRALDHDPRNLDRAPRELYEQFGLIKKPAAEEGASGASGRGGKPEGQGDRDLPVKAPAGAKNKGSKEPATNSEE